VVISRIVILVLVASLLAPQATQARERDLDGRQYDISLTPVLASLTQDGGICLPPPYPPLRARLIFDHGILRVRGREVDEKIIQTDGYQAMLGPDAEYSGNTLEFTGAIKSPLVSEAVTAMNGTGCWAGEIEDGVLSGTLNFRMRGYRAVGYTFTGMQIPPLYDRLGGEWAVRAVVSAFIDRLLDDAQLNANPSIRAARDRVDVHPFRPETIARLRELLATAHGVPPVTNRELLKAKIVDLVGQVSGGPQRYTGRNLKDVHATMGITGRDWDRTVAILAAVLEGAGVPLLERDELIGLIATTRPAIVQMGE
jgi:hemoglobin